MESGVKQSHRVSMWSAVVGILVLLLASASLVLGGLVQAQDAQDDGPIKHPEHTPITAPVAEFTATDDEDDKAGKALKWSVTGTDAAYFDISQAGVLTFVESPPSSDSDWESPPNYEAAKAGGSTEAANTYNINVTVTDSDGGDTDHAVVVMVTNVDEPATLTLSNRQPVDGVAIMATLTDVDGSLSNQDWQWARGSSRNGSFTDIEKTTSNGAETATYTPAPSDIGKYLRLTVTYTDGEGSGKDESVVSYAKVLASRSSNAAPVIVDSEGDEITDAAITRKVDENSAAGTEVGGPILVSNAENDVLTFKLSGAAADKFDIDSNGQITVGDGTILDTETSANASYTVTVTVSDGNFRNSGTATDFSDSINVNITAENVEEDPELDGKATVDHEENTPIATPVAKYTVTDDEDDSTDTVVEVKLSGADEDLFTLTDTTLAGGTADDGMWELAFKAMPDFESPADVGRDRAYNVTVTAEDSSDRTAVLNVVVMVTNVEEDGMVELSTQAPKVGVELTATLIGDEDGATSSPTWKWERADAAAFDEGDNVTEIEGATSADYIPVFADEGKWLRATAMYTDPEGEDSASKVSAAAVLTTNMAPWFDDTNTADTDESMVSRSVNEDEYTTNTVVGDPVTATDPEDASLTYELSGDAAPFEIDRGTAQISVRAGQTLDTETKDKYVVTVTATDPDGLSATATVTITITNVQEDPVVGGDDAPKHPEHTPITAPVAEFTATDDEDDKAGKALKWSVTGTDAAYFDISQAGVLTFVESPPSSDSDWESPPNYEAAKAGGSTEAANTYNINVTVTDSDGGDTDHAVVVMVTNVDEPATLTLSNRQPVDGVAIMATLTDVDGSLSNQDWQWARGSSRNGSFTDIEKTTSNGAETATYTPAPSDIGKYLRLTVTYTDGEGSGKDESVVSYAKVLASRSSNAAPVIVDSEGDEITDAAITRKVDENSAAGTEVGGPILVSNAENDVLTFKLSGAAADKFDIDSNGQITVGDGTILDTETSANASYTVTVTVSDGNFRNSGTATDFSDSINVNITAENVEEDPELDGKATVDHEENTPIATPVAKYTVTDDEDDSTDTVVEVKLSGADEDLFTLTDTTLAGGTADDGMWELAFKAMPDFESPADVGRDRAYNVTVTAEDSSDRTAVLNVVVMVTNVEEDGMVELSTQAPKVGVELTATLIGDEDGATSSPTWKWERADAAAFDEGDNVTEIEGATSADYIPVFADEGKWLRATAMYTDPEGEDSASKVSAAAVLTTNMAPWFDDTNTADTDESMVSRSVNEDEYTTNTVVGDPVTATDPEDASLTYELSGDAAPFEIDRGTAQISVRAGQTLDTETKDKYVVTVTATDPDGLSATATVTITITNVQEDPVVSRGSGSPNQAPRFPAETADRSVPENASAGDNIGAPVSADDPGDTLTYTLEGLDEASFDIDSATGQLQAKAPLDRDTKSTYTVTVKATDQGGLYDTVVVTITVTEMDENQAPVFPFPTTSREIAENTGAGENIGPPVEATDGDDDPLTYELSGADMADFDIDRGTGQLKTKSPLDYEAKSTYTVTVTARDGNGGHDDVTVTITVTDVDETQQTLLDRYDADDSGEIELSEAFQAVDDYFDSIITLDEVFKVIDLYFDGS